MGLTDLDEQVTRYFDLLNYFEVNLNNGLINSTFIFAQFTFYASYHHNGLNKLIHIFCVWPILWTALVFLQFISIEAPFPNPVHPANVACFAAIFYAVVYILMDKR